MTKAVFCLLLVSWVGAVLAADDVVLPGENVLGQTKTDCDEGKANNDPRRGGKSEVGDSIDDDDEAGEETHGRLI